MPFPLWTWVKVHCGDCSLSLSLERRRRDNDKEEEGGETGEDVFKILFWTYGIFLIKILT